MNKVLVVDDGTILGTAIVAKVIELQHSNMARAGINMEKKMQRHIDGVNFNLNGKKSVEYAKARAAINQDVNELYKDNAAGGKNFKVAAKKTSIEFLGGKIQKEADGKKWVVFPDNSKARY